MKVVIWPPPNCVQAEVLSARRIARSAVQHHSSYGYLINNCPNTFQVEELYGPDVVLGSPSNNVAVIQLHKQLVAN